MRIAIIGGGITGLVAAKQLSEKGNKVSVFEKDSFLGGLASCFKDDSFSWPVERYYHHFFTSDDEVFQLAENLGIKEKLFFSNPITSIFIKSNFYRFDDPISLLKFPFLGIIDKIRTGLTLVFLKISPFWKLLEKIPASDFIIKTMGPKTYKLIWQPLLVGKFGECAEKIPASFLWTRIKKRSSSLGYFQGSTQLLIDKLQEKIVNNGGEIYLSHPISKVTKPKDSFEVFDKSGNFAGKFDRVILTISPDILSEIVPGLSSEEKNKLKSFDYLGSICLILLLKKQLFKDQTYWLNINEEDFPFLAVVEHTNFIESKNFGGNHLVYIGGYYSTKDPLFKKDKQELLEEFLPFIKKISPEIDLEKDLVSSWLFKDPYSQPVVRLNYSLNIPSIKTSISGLFWASLNHVYPEDRGVNYAIELGNKVANEIAKE